MASTLVRFSEGLKAGAWRAAPETPPTALGRTKQRNPLSPQQSVADDPTSTGDDDCSSASSSTGSSIIDDGAGPIAQVPSSSAAAASVLPPRLHLSLGRLRSTPGKLAKARSTELTPEAAIYNGSTPPRSNEEEDLIVSLTPGQRSPLTPSFVYDDFDPHIYTHLAMADFSIGDDVEEALLRPGNDELATEDVAEPESITVQRRAVVREAHEMFVTLYGATHLPDLRAAVAPGRVNLIGEHVDYCDGFVLPMAIPLYTAAIGRRASDPSRNFVEVHSVYYNDTVRITQPYDEGKENYPQWARYVQGILALFPSSFPPLDILIHSHLPPGSSLSSSAALELSVLFLLMEFVGEGERLGTREAALLAQKAEHVYAGVPCGIMDQLVITAARNQKALKIDCLSLEYEFIPMSIAHDVVFLVTNSGVKHALATSEYAKRRSAVDRAVKLIGVNSWRDVNQELLHQRSSSLTGEEDMMLQRATHVVEEIARTVEAANALLDNNIILFGKLMTASHESLKKYYSVSCAELDELVDIALSVEGVFGARMTGGGFGGCTVSMVRKDAVERLKTEIKSRYSGSATFLECEPVSGVRAMPLDFLVLHPPSPKRKDSI